MQWLRCLRWLPASWPRQAKWPPRAANGGKARRRSGSGPRPGAAGTCGCCSRGAGGRPLLATTAACASLSGVVRDDPDPTNYCYLGESSARCLASGRRRWYSRCHYLLEGVVEVSVRRGSLGAALGRKSPSCSHPTLLASADVIPFLEASLEHFCHCPASLADEIPGCTMPAVLQLPLRFGLSTSGVVVAAVVVFFATATWSLVDTVVFFLSMATWSLADAVVSFFTAATWSLEDTVVIFFTAATWSLGICWAFY